jgi:ethanolamine permease
MPSVVTLLFQLQDPAYRGAVLPVACWMGLGIPCFAAIGRHRLALSPEERFAVSGGRAVYDAE